MSSDTIHSTATSLFGPTAAVLRWLGPEPGLAVAPLIGIHSGGRAVDRRKECS